MIWVRVLVDGFDPCTYVLSRTHIRTCLGFWFYAYLIWDLVNALWFLTLPVALYYLKGVEARWEKKKAAKKEVLPVVGNGKSA